MANMLRRYAALVAGFGIAALGLTPMAANATETLNAADTIHVEVSAVGDALDLLSEDFAIVDVEGITPPFAHSHLVIGPAGLDRPLIMALVVQAYRAGLTVAIANATQREADRFDMLVDGGEGASCRPRKGQREIALYGMQQTLTRQPPVASRYCLPDASTTDDQTRQAVRGWLRARFASTPPSEPVAGTGASTVNLDDLAKKTHCSELVFNDNGQIQADVFLSSLRSFGQQSDYYYVNNFVQYVPKVLNYDFSTRFWPPNYWVGWRGARLLFTEPSTTAKAVSQYTNSRSTTVSGGVGFGTSGFDVEASASVTVGTETTVTVPPVTILNTSNLQQAFPVWSFEPANSIPNALFDALTSFLWIVNRDFYQNDRELWSQYHAEIGPGVLLRLVGICYYDQPFPTWDVDAPQITSVHPETARQGGGTFVIRGEQMYPSIVDSVLLGGDALPTTNFVPIDDTEIKATVPGSQALGLNPVQVNTFFNGQVLPSNNDVELDVEPR